MAELTKGLNLRVTANDLARLKTVAKRQNTTASEATRRWIRSTVTDTTNAEEMTNRAASQQVSQT